MQTPFLAKIDKKNKVMKKGIIYPTTQISVKLTKQAESIEEMLRRVRNSKEPIQANAKVNYTERADGVLPMYDIRTDRFDYAMQAADRVHATRYASRMQEDGFKQNENGTWSKMTAEELAAANKAMGGGEAN